MKFFLIPSTVLALLLALSIWNGRAVENAVEPWQNALAASVEAAERENWEEAERLVRETRAAWEQKHPWFHVFTVHDQLDQADALFAAAQSFAGERESAEFHASVSELYARLDVVKELQSLSARNIF